VTVQKKRLTILHYGITVLEIDPAFADGLHFRAEEHDSGLELLQNEIVVKGLLVGSHEFFAGGLFFHLSIPRPENRTRRAAKGELRSAPSDRSVRCVPKIRRKENITGQVADKQVTM
jgi:hypothetical protein